MGDCTVLFSGDLPQILSVITRGTRADEVNASLKRLYLWPHIMKCELKINMRIASSKDNKQFSIDLLQIGNGEFQAVIIFVFW
jgi:PIF1 helicase.